MRGFYLHNLEVHRHVHLSLVLLLASHQCSYHTAVTVERAGVVALQITLSSPPVSTKKKSHASVSRRHCEHVVGRSTRASHARRAQSVVMSREHRVASGGSRDIEHAAIAGNLGVEMSVASVKEVKERYRP